MKRSVIILLLFVATQLVCAAAAMLFENFSTLIGGQSIASANLSASPVMMGQALFFGNFVLIALLAALKLIRRPFSFRADSRFEKGGAWMLPAMALLAVGLSFLLQPLALPDDGSMAMFAAMKHNALCMLLLAVVGPITEELVFREGIQRSLSASGLPHVWAAAATAVLFSLVHGNLAQAIPAVLLGFALGLLYIKTGNVRLSCAAHVLNNTLALLLLHFPQTEAWLADNAAFSALLGALLFVGGASMLVFWWRKTPVAHSLFDSLKNEDRKN